MTAGGCVASDEDTDSRELIAVTMKTVLEDRTPAMRSACTVVHGWHEKRPDSRESAYREW